MTRKPYTLLTQPVSPYMRAKAVIMWKEGNDTWQIGKALKIPEYQVYNSLPKWRQEAQART